jgi:phenylacetate-CoA ligase
MTKRVISEKEKEVISNLSKAGKTLVDASSSLSKDSVTNYERLIRNQPEDFWVKKGEQKALKVFHAAADRVPAYKDFLKKHKVNPDLVRTIKDFQKVPLTDKKNYITRYSLVDRMWDGDISSANLIAMSSGTSGEPQYWPRSARQDFEAALIHELIFKYIYEVHKYRTLMVIGFPMGVYVSGIATVLPTWLVSLKKKYPITFASVGTSKAELLKVVQSFQSDFDQIVLFGHPFPIKDLLETGKDNGIDWSQKRVKTFFCSEGFSEAWRSYINSLLGVDDWQSVISTYGSSEMLLMGHETPMSIMLRNLAEGDPVLRDLLGVQGITPSVFQYNPLLRYIENYKQDLVFTSDSGVPLIRFNMKDAGKIIGFNKSKEVLDKNKGAWKQMLRQKSTTPIWQLPFVTLNGRSDHTLVFYAANIYPEHVHEALNHPRFAAEITGKFFMRKDYLSDLEQYLEIHIELRPETKPGKLFKDSLQKHIFEVLKKVNMEYLFLTEKLDKDLTPRVVVWEYGHEKYFKVGRKPKYLLLDSK